MAPLLQALLPENPMSGNSCVSAVEKLSRGSVPQQLFSENTPSYACSCSCDVRDQRHLLYELNKHGSVERILPGAVKFYSSSRHWLEYGISNMHHLFSCMFLPIMKLKLDI